MSRVGRLVEARPFCSPDTSTSKSKLTKAKSQLWAHSLGAVQEDFYLFKDATKRARRKLVALLQCSFSSAEFAADRWRHCGHRMRLLKWHFRKVVARSCSFLWGSTLALGVLKVRLESSQSAARVQLVGRRARTSRHFREAD